MATLTDRILKAAKKTKTGPLSWIEKIPPDVAKGLLSLKKRFQAGELDVSGRSLAKAMFAECQTQGVKTCGEDHLRIWLYKRD